MAAANKVLQTVELLDSILHSLPLDSILQLRNVCHSRRELISSATWYRKIQSDPYIGVTLQLPFECSVSQQAPAILEAHFVLYYDQMATVRQTAGSVKFPKTTFYMFEEDTVDPLSALEFREAIWGNKYFCKLHYFRADTADNWKILFPGIAFRFSWEYREDCEAGRSQHWTWLQIEPKDTGKRLELQLRPNLYAGHLVGTKRDLLREVEGGGDLRASILERGLPMIAENEVRYLAMP